MIECGLKTWQNCTCFLSSKGFGQYEIISLYISIGSVQLNSTLFIYFYFFCWVYCAWHILSCQDSSFMYILKKKNSKFALFLFGKLLLYFSSSKLQEYWFGVWVGMKWHKMV